VHSFAWWPTTIAVLVAATIDLRVRRIPNWLVLPFFTAGVGVSTWAQGWQGLSQSLEGSVLGLLVYGSLFWVGGMGAGDVKLCAAIGAWIGPRQLMLALILTALAGGMMAIAWAAAGGFFTELMQGTGYLILGKHRHSMSSIPEEEDSAQVAPPGFLRRKMPYAPAIAVGTLLSFLAR
jgi:prepilin peptidase CpaA